MDTTILDAQEQTQDQPQLVLAETAPIVVKRKRGPVPKPKIPKEKPVKPPRVNLTDDPLYYPRYFQQHKKEYQVYADRAKEKFHHCAACNITTAFRHHLRHDRTPRHIRNSTPVVV